MDNKTLPAFCVAAAKDPPTKWKTDAMGSDFFNPDGTVIRAVVGANKKGSVDAEKAREYLELLKRCWPDISPEDPVLLVFDGCSTHIGYQFLSRAKELGFLCVLRPPHTTHKTQVEDVNIFGHFQAAFRTALDAELST